MDQKKALNSVQWGREKNSRINPGKQVLGRVAGRNLGRMSGKGHGESHV